MNLCNDHRFDDGSFLPFDVVVFVDNVQDNAGDGLDVFGGVFFVVHSVHGRVHENCNLIVSELIVEEHVRFYFFDHVHVV